MIVAQTTSDHHHSQAATISVPGRQLITQRRRRARGARPQKQHALGSNFLSAIAFFHAVWISR